MKRSEMIQIIREASRYQLSDGVCDTILTTMEQSGMLPPFTSYVYDSVLHRNMVKLHTWDTEEDSDE